MPVSSQPGGPATPVILLATSTANDQLAQFQVQFTGITLTSQSGQTATLLASTVYPEMMHLNGVAEPLVSSNLPRGTYTSASVSIGSALFVCTSYSSTQGLQTSTFVYGQVPASSVHVTLAEPIVVSRSPVAVVLKLDIARSASLSNCQGGPTTTFSITPTMTLAPAAISATPTNSANGLLTGMLGLVTQIQSDAGAFTVAGADGTNLAGPSWTLTANTGTFFQGVSSTAGLAPGMPVDLDASIQPDGTLAATRVSVYDTDTTDLNVFTGPISNVSALNQSLLMIGEEQQGYLDNNSYYSGGELIGDQNAAFRMAGPPDRFAGLSFTPVFDASTAVPGQNVSVTSHMPLFLGGALPAATVTLMPQTINGTVKAVNTVGIYTTYSVSLASYDLFPNLALQPDQQGVLHNPGTVIVYAGPQTKISVAGSLGVGSLIRSYGEVVNDQGTLRMICLQLSQGVTE